MKKLIIPLLITLSNATTIGSLFDAIQNIPESKIDEILVKEAKENKKSIINSLYPKVTLFANSTHYNREMSIVPITPTESASLLAKNKPLPFSQNIHKIGINVSVPLFIKSIYDNKKKISYLIKATNYQTKINLLQREALLVTLVSKLNYLFKLKKALNTQKNSIKTSLKAIEVGVKVGRIPEFKALRLKDALNQIEIKIEDINSNISKTKSEIYKLTKQNISFISFSAKDFDKGEFLFLKPIKEEIKAFKTEIEVKKDSFYPKVTLQMNANRAFAKAYNTSSQIALNTASIGIYFNLELNKKNFSEIKKAKLAYQKSQLKLLKTIKDLKAEIEYINSSLKTIKKAINKTKNSIKIKEELLKGAKVAFKLNEMSVDEYLRYEDDLAKAKADLANLIATKNSLLAQKALIYGKNFKKVFK